MNPQLILIGAPGAGKGSLAAPLVQQCGYNHVSTGDLLREEIKAASEIGKKISSIMQSGGLVDDTLVFELLMSKCDPSTKSYIFDGFPRTIAQAQMLVANVLKNSNFKVIVLDIDTQVIMNRLVNRRSCKQCGTIFNLKTLPPKSTGICDNCSGELVQRSDDTESVVSNRLKVFSDTVAPIIEYFENMGRVIHVNAAAGTNDILITVKEKLDLV